MVAKITINLSPINFKVIKSLTFELEYRSADRLQLMREYSYRCHDFSLLTPGFKKWFVAPLLPFVPWSIPANIVTIISNLFVYIGFFVALYFQSPLSRLIVAICLFLYLVGDHLDGMQAKRTKTGSALGEFCDHYLDAFNNGIILFTAFLVFDVSNQMLIGVVLGASYLAHMAVFYEQFKTGWLTFEKLGSLEAVLLISILIGISSLDAAYGFISTQTLFSYRLIEIVFAGSAAGAIVTFATTLFRTPNRTTGVWLFVAGLAVVTGMGVFQFTGIQLFILITLYASFYVGLVMRGHLIDGIERLPDLVIPGALFILFFINQSNMNSAFLILVVYLLVRILLLVGQTFNALKVYWVWSNPRI